MPSSKRYFPLYLDLTGRKCLVVGGGEVAVSRIESFLDCGADVTVVAEEASDQIRLWAEHGKVRWLRRRVLESDTTGAFLVVLTTDDQSVKRTVCTESGMACQLINSHDDAANSNFIYPAVARSGPMQVAVTSSGKSPAMAQRLRDRIERETLPKSLGDLADFLGSKRSLVTNSLPTYESRKRFWGAVLDSPIPGLLLENNHAAEVLFLGLLDAFKNEAASVEEVVAYG